MWAIPTKSAEKLTSSLLATLDVCFKEKPDLVHYHSFTHQTTFLPRSFGIPVLITGQGLEWKRSRWNKFGSSFLKLSEKIMVRSASSISVVSRVQQNYLKEKYDRESTYIPQGVNKPEIFKPDDITRMWGLKGRDYILTAVRLVQEKGVHYLIEAFKGMKTDLKLVIAGDAAHEKAYLQKLKDLAGDNPNIIFTGYVTGKLYGELRSNPYAFVLASEIEGLPTVLLEAMSYGNCCVASDIPENLEALRGKGLSFKNKTPEDLRDRLTELAQDPQKAAHYRSTSTEGMEEFYWDKIAREYNDLYVQMARKPGL